MNEQDDSSPDDAYRERILVLIPRVGRRELLYEPEQAPSMAEGEVLHDSIEDLSPDTALDAVLSTTSLLRDDAQPDVIRIGIKAATR